MNTIISVSSTKHPLDKSLCVQPQWLLVYCTGGQSSCAFTDGYCITCNKGDLSVIPPNTFCSFETSDGYSDIRIWLTHPSFYSASAFIISDNEQQYLRASFEQALNYYSSETSINEQLMDSLGAVIANYISALNSAATYTPPVAQIHTLILQHYPQADFALDNAIREMPFHYDYLRKRFKLEVGRTPKEYLTELRMGKARTLLSASYSGKYTVSEIAEQCGFKNPLYFSRIFKKYHGVAPSAFVSKGRTR